MGRSGAHVLAVQPDPERLELFYCCKELLSTVHHFHHGGIRQLATRIIDELAHPDSVTPLLVEGLALEMLAMAARLDSVRVDSVAPPWLLRVRDLLHEKFAERLDNTEIARMAGVHPVHLARTFRKHYRMSIGSYVRSLRLDWAAARLAASNEQISDIALRAGFADQSHFTRHFRSHTGTTPLRYRRAAPHK
jgi:AraC family transcriptional regulator